MIGHNRNNFGMRKQQEPNKRVGKLQLGPQNLSKTHYSSYLNSSVKKSKDLFRTLQPFDPIDMPMIQQCVETVDLTPIQQERKKIAQALDSQPESVQNQWKLYMSKAEIFGTPSNSWYQLQSYLLKMIQKLLKQFSKSRKTIDQLHKLRQEYQITQQNTIILNETINNNFEDHSNLCQRSFRTQFTQSGFPKGLQKFRNKAKISLQNSKMAQRNKQKSLLSIKTGKLSPLQTDMINTRMDSELASFNNQLYQKKNLNYTTLTRMNKQKCQNSQISNADNTIFFQISKLDKQNMLLRQRINELEKENGQKVVDLQKRVQESLKIRYHENLEEKHKYQSDLQNKKFYNEILSKQFKSLQLKHEKLEEQYQKLKKQHQILKKQHIKINQLDQYRQMWLMQHQQIFSLKQTLAKLKTEKEGQIKKTSGLKQKLKELSKNYNYSYNVSADNQKNKQDVAQILKQFRDWLKFIAVPRISKGMMNDNTFFPEMVIESTKETYGLVLPKDDSNNYKLLRPNFFIYFEAYEGIIIAQKKFPQRKIMPPQFFLTIRGILDSMFLHLTFTTDYKKWLNFPQFVISYIQKFQINSQTWKPRVRKNPIQSEQKISFILNVFNLQAANSWQCEIFRSFLLEEYVIDEVYFYLCCRDSLLKGAQINNNLGSADPINYVRVETAEKVVKEKLKSYDNQMVQKIKGFIHSKKKVKNYTKSFIDVNFVLKLLLEVYSIEKIKSEKFFHHSFKSKIQNSKITYTQYASFMMKNFDYLTKGDIAKLYRQIYTLGVGQITYKTIHFVCSTRGLFIPLVRQKMMNKNSNNNNHNTELNENEGKRQWGLQNKKRPEVFDDIVCLDLMNNVNKMIVNVQEFGLEEFLSINISLNKFLHENEKLKDYRSLFENKLLEQTEKIIKLQAIYRWKSSQSVMNSNEIISEYEHIDKDEQRQKISHLLAITHHTDDYVGNLRKWRQTRQRSIYKLTKNFKIRIRQSLAEFTMIGKDEEQFRNKIADNVEIRQADEEEEDQNDQKD